MQAGSNKSTDTQDHGTGHLLADDGLEAALQVVRGGPRRRADLAVGASSIILLHPTPTCSTCLNSDGERATAK